MELMYLLIDMGNKKRLCRAGRPEIRLWVYMFSDRVLYFPGGA